MGVTRVRRLIGERMVSFYQYAARADTVRGHSRRSGGGPAVLLAGPKNAAGRLAVAVMFDVCRLPAASR